MLISISFRSFYSLIGPPRSPDPPECIANVHLLDPFGSLGNGRCSSSPPPSRSERARASCTVHICAHRAPSALVRPFCLDILVLYANPFPSVALRSVTAKPEGVVISAGPHIFFGQDDSCPDRRLLVLDIFAVAEYLCSTRASDTPTVKVLTASSSS